MPSQNKPTRVFKGKIFDVYQWRQKMFDGSYETFEHVKRQDTVIILATVKDRVVILRQRQPHTKWFYTTPAGRMDKPGETPKNAALRELMEETGMVPGKFFLWKKYRHTQKVFFNVYFYVARNCKKILAQKLDPGEKIKVKLISFEKFLKLTDDLSSRHWLGETLIDMYKARLDKNYRKYFKKILFG